MALVLLVLGATELGGQLKADQPELFIPLILIGFGIGFPIIFVVIPEISNGGGSTESESYTETSGSSDIDGDVG